MTKNDWKIMATAFLSVVVVGIAVFGAMLLFMSGKRGSIPDTIEPITLTQELVEGPKTLVISCKEERGAYHKLICSVNAEVMGRWMVRERVDGELRRGTQSVFAFNQWEMAVGSDVSPTILIQFIPTGLTAGISLEYRMNTEYMRKGVQNFASDVI